MKKITYLLLCGVFIGCATIDSVHENFQKVNYSDGIDLTEAQYIAQERLLQAGMDKKFNYKSALVIRNYLVRPHSGYWFVKFGATKFNRSFWDYLVVIDKKNGEIIFSEPYVPLEIVDYDWVFEK